MLAYFALFLPEISHCTYHAAPCAHEGVPTNSQHFAFKEALPHLCHTEF